jgi:hypothetical protein
MQYENVFIGLGVLLICVLAFFGNTGLVTKLNTDYNNTFVTNDSLFLGSIQNITGPFAQNYGAVGRDIGNATEGTEGSGTTDSTTDLLRRSIQIISTVKEMLGLAPLAMEEAGRAVGIGEEYIGIAITMFVVVFGLMLGYLFLIGVRRLI